MVKAKANPDDDLRPLGKVEAERQKRAARYSTRPSVKAGSIIDAAFPFTMRSPDDPEGTRADVSYLMDAILERQDAVKKGDLSTLESMLVAQAFSLDALFHRLAVMGCKQEGRANIQVIMGLALRAQNGCRATIETLAAVKNPQGFTVVKQVNAANVQQVNNAPQPPALARAANEPFAQSKLLEEQYGPQWLEPGAPAEAARIDTPVAAVAALDRPEDARGKGRRGPQRVQGQRARRAAPVGA